MTEEVECRSYLIFSYSLLYIIIVSYIIYAVGYLVRAAAVTFVELSVALYDIYGN